MKRKADTLEVENFYERLGKDSKKQDKNNPYFHVHGLKIPFRMLIVGASGSMKTNAALDICKKFSDTFHHITIVTRNIKEPLYKYLQEKIPEDQLTIFEIEEDDLSQLPKMGELDENAKPTLLIFDDLVLVKNQKKITEYFIRCRKYNISVMYLTQSYFNTPKTIRGNCNIITFKKINSKNDLRMALREYSLSMELSDLAKLHAECTKDQKDWLMIRIDNPMGEQFYHNYKCIKTGTDGKEDEKKLPNVLDLSSSDEEEDIEAEDLTEDQPSEELEKKSKLYVEKRGQEFKSLMKNPRFKYKIIHEK